MDASQSELEAEPKDTEENLNGVTVEQQAVRELIQADTVAIAGSQVNQIMANEVEVDQSGILKIDANSLNIAESGVGAAATTDLRVTDGGVGFARGERIEVNGGIGVAVSDKLSLAESQVGVAFANTVTAKNSRAVILLAGQVDGDIEVMMDTQRSLLVGLVAGVAVGLVMLVGNLLTRRS